MAVASLLLFECVALVAADLIVKAGGSPGGPSQAVEISLAAMGVSALAIYAFAFIARSGFGWRGAGAPWLVLKAYPAFLIIWFLISFFAYSRCLDAMGQTLPPQTVLDYFAGEPGNSSGRFVAILVVCIMGPLSEEIVFRGFVQGALANFMNRWVAVLTASAIFGAYHGLLYAFPVGLLGLFFGWLRERTGGLAAPALAHMIHNSITVALALFFPDAMDWLYDR